MLMKMFKKWERLSSTQPTVDTACALDKKNEKKNSGAHLNPTKSLLYSKKIMAYLDKHCKKKESTGGIVCGNASSLLETSLSASFPFFVQLRGK